jgi:hypothetical protein
VCVCECVYICVVNMCVFVFVCVCGVSLVFRCDPTLCMGADYK